MTNDSSGPHDPAPGEPTPPEGPQRDFEWQAPDTAEPPAAAPASPSSPSTPPSPEDSATPEAPASQPAETPQPELDSPAAPPPPDDPGGSSPLDGPVMRWVVPLLAAAVVIAGILWWSSRDDDGSDDPGTAQQGDTAALEVGDCLKEPKAGKVTAITTVPCAEKHRTEVYATFDLANAADAYPSKKKLFRVAGVGCAKRFEAFMGTPPTKTLLTRSELVPDAIAWEAGSRRVTCLASMPGGKQTVGSLEGKRK